MEFFKTIGGKIATGLVALAVVAGTISWFQTPEATRDEILAGTGKIVSWFLVMLVVPWVTFFLIGWVARLERNAAGAVLVAVYTAAEAAVLAWLFDWSIQGATAWVFFAAAVLIAGVYNLFTCDWIAEKAA
jgi:FtsH-binding integral membrane protein